MMAGARVWKPHSVVSVASPFVASSIRNERWKLIPPSAEKKSYVTAYNKLPISFPRNPYAESALLFDLHSDPEGKTNVASKHPDIVQSLTTKLEKLSGSGGFVKTRLSRDVLQVLAEEGYLDPEEARK